MTAVPIRAVPLPERRPDRDRVDDAAFKEAMAAVAAPVAVATTRLGGVPHGTTVSAFTSLSMDPPSVLVSLGQGSRLLRKVCHAGRFGLNVLAADQSDLAAAFAGTGAEAFAHVDWADDGGAPRFPSTHGWVLADVDDLVTSGDHVIVVGNVVSAESTPREPLVYHRRSFGTHAPLPAR